MLASRPNPAGAVFSLRYVRRMARGRRPARIWHIPCEQEAASSDQREPGETSPEGRHQMTAGGPLATDVLEQSSEKVPPLIGHDQTPCPRQVTRVRRPVPATSDHIDRLPAPGASLAEHLSRQLSTTRHDPRKVALAAWVAGNLDPDGYLRESLAELAPLAGCEPGELEEALAVVQSLEPTGVGARTLRECLLLQLYAHVDPDPVAVELVDHHLAALAMRRYDDLAHTLRQPVDRILRALATIRRLEPRPGRPFDDVPAPAVRPEVAIEKGADGYRVILRDEDAPQVDVRQHSRAEAAAPAGETRGYLASCIRTAGWLMSALDRRRHTIRGVVESILRWQPDFLTHGPGSLRPLSFSRVAADLGLHESTVSRAVAHRYVDTPHGVFPLRFFFTSGLPGDPTGIVSARTACHRIRALVDAEDPACPMPDRRIAQALAASGIRIARRTVVKYRELLGIGSAARRRVCGVAATRA
jgi:RNA polymerase sigma-54 factor